MNNNKNILLSDVKTTRKCGGCGEIIVLEDELFKDEISIGYHAKQKKSYHKDCFFQSMSERKRPPDNIPELWDEMLGCVEFLRGVMFKNHLYVYFGKMFGVTLFTSSFYQKMEQIYNGKWKNVTKSVKPEHLLDMFIRRDNEIKKILTNVGLSGLSGLNYAISVIVNKYDGYLGWLEKSKIDNHRVSIEMELETPKIRLLTRTESSVTDDDIFTDIDE